MCHVSVSSNLRGGGISAELPLGAPSSTHLTMVAISWSDSDTSFLKWRTPTFLSMYQGGISRATTFCVIDLAQGLASSKVSRDMGANVSGRWHTWQRFWRIGATSFVKVTCVWDVCCAPAVCRIVRAIPAERVTFMVVASQVRC